MSSTAPAAPASEAAIFDSSSAAAAAAAAAAEPLMFCPNCNTLWHRNELPVTCYMNGLESGPTPPALVDLSAVERTLLAPVQVFLTLIPLLVGGLWSRRNLYIFVPCPEQIAQLQTELPATGHVFVSRPRSARPDDPNGRPLVLSHLHHFAPRTLRPSSSPLAASR